MALKLSGLVITKNESDNIKGCLRSLSFCDEVVVIDDNSTDDTVKIARGMKARVHKRDMMMNVSDQLNFGLKKARGKWVLNIDADERISKKLQKEILENLNEAQENVGGFEMGRVDYMWGKWLLNGEVGSFRAVRLVRKGKGRWIRRVHQKYLTKGVILGIESLIWHYPHKTVEKFLESINRWSTWHAIANKEDGKKSSLVKITFWPVGHFLKNYIFRLGFLDGLQGFLYAMIMASHSFLAWSKLYMLQKGFTKI